jgi:hypothetical protein
MQLLFNWVVFLLETIFLYPIIHLSELIHSSLLISRLPGNPIFSSNILDVVPIYHTTHPLQSWIDFFNRIAEFILYFAFILFTFVHMFILIILAEISPETCLFTTSTSRTNSCSTNAFNRPWRSFHTSSLVSSGLSRHNTHPSVPVNIQSISNLPFWESGTPLPEGKPFYIHLPSIHTSNFISILFERLSEIVNDTASGIQHINLLLEARLEGNRFRSVSTSCHLTPGFTLDFLERHYTEAILNFEAQSGTGEDGPSVVSARLRIIFPELP